MMPVEAGLRITPRVLNLRSRGRWISATLTIPSDADAHEIDPDTILLEGSIPSEDLIQRGNTLRMKFDRQALHALLTESGNTELTVTAETTEGGKIYGTDIIRVIP